MSDLTHLFKVGQAVRWRADGRFYKGTIKETYPDYIMVDVPEISDHMRIEQDCIGDIFPEYNFNESGGLIWG